MAKIGFISLGCSKNQLDTEVMLHELMTAGHEITAEDSEAEVIIVNTCGFTESAKQESIDNILDVAWLKKNAKLKGIVVTGCLAERYRGEILDTIPEADAVLGVGSLHDITEAVSAVLSGEHRFVSFKDKEKLTLGGDRVVTTPDYMAYMKIAEGCDNRCTYCAIPMIRGGFRSRGMEELVCEAKTLEALGTKELILVAQDSSRYGLDLYGEYKLDELIRRITEETSIPWLRVLYCYPDKITDGLIGQLRDNPRLVKYIDLPIQHISDSVLKRMNRHGGRDAVRETVEKLRSEVPGIVIRTTVIVGFPGETEEDFTELCEYIKEAEFDRLGAFTYSREEGTPAYDLDGQLDEQTKQDRYDIIMREQLDINERLNRKKIGETVTVLCEGYDNVAATHFGRSAADAPDIDGKVYFHSRKKIPEGAFVEVKIEDVIDYDLIGSVV